MRVRVKTTGDEHQTYVGICAVIFTFSEAVLHKSGGNTFTVKSNNIVEITD